MQWRFVPPDKQKEIQRMYDIIARKSSEAKEEALDRVWKDPNLKPKRGDTFVSKGEEYVVTGLDVSPRGEFVVQLMAKEQPTMKARIASKATLLRRVSSPTCSTRAS